MGHFSATPADVSLTSRTVPARDVLQEDWTPHSALRPYRGGRLLLAAGADPNAASGGRRYPLRASKGYPDASASSSPRDATRTRWTGPIHPTPRAASQGDERHRAMTDGPLSAGGSAFDARRREKRTGQTPIWWRARRGRTRRRWRWRGRGEPGVEDCEGATLRRSPQTGVGVRAIGQGDEGRVLDGVAQSGNEGISCWVYDA